MNHAQPTTELRRGRVIRLWLLAVAALVFAIVLVGGATRLTESGLSIVEWQPVSGTLPPLTEAQWQTEFEKYQAIPQYQQLNRGMSLSEFKTIFWWEWTHRILGRVIGIAFALPFLFFLWRGWIGRELGKRLWAIMGLGALQGAVGWWMVASGLVERTSVSQYRLAFHLTLACVIYAALLWTALRLIPRPVPVQPWCGRAGALGIMVLVLLQIYLGALVAGLDAGLIYNTWPLIDGALIPDTSRLLFEQPLWRNFFENALTVQFQHRIVAYLLFLCVVLHGFDIARRRERAAFGSVLILLAAVAIQVALGVTTLLYQAPLSFALLHQAMAMVVLTAALIHAARIVVKPLPVLVRGRR